MLRSRRAGGVRGEHKAQQGWERRLQATSLMGLPKQANLVLGC